jgi:hypothetical protein
MQLLPVNRFQVQFIKRRWQSLLRLKIDPVEESLLLSKRRNLNVKNSGHRRRKRFSDMVWIGTPCLIKK